MTQRKLHLTQPEILEARIAPDLFKVGDWLIGTSNGPNGTSVNIYVPTPQQGGGYMLNNPNNPANEYAPAPIIRDPGYNIYQIWPSMKNIGWTIKPNP